MHKIAIIEKFRLYGDGIKALLNQSKLAELVAESQTVEGLKGKLGRDIPDVIVIDISRAEGAGLKILRKATRTFSRSAILIITAQEYSSSFEDYISIGVKGFIFSNASSGEFLDAITRLLDGNDYFTLEVWNLIKKKLQTRKHSPKEGRELSERETTVLKLFTKGFSYKEIGARLNISPRTVETHKRNILSKLKICTTAEMIVYAIHNHLTL